jgi:hypothetical protein
MLKEHDGAADIARLQEDSTEAQKVLQEKLSRIADKSAKRIVNRQQRYDGDQGIFTW